MEDLIDQFKAAQYLIEKLEGDKKYYIDLLESNSQQLVKARTKIKELEETIERLMYLV